MNEEKREKMYNKRQICDNNNLNHKRFNNRIKISGL